MMVETLVHGGIGGAISAFCIFVVHLYTERNRNSRRKQEIESAAQQAKRKLESDVEATGRQATAQARKDALLEWEKIASYHESQVEILRQWNHRQQEQIDKLRADWADCERRHNSLEEKIASMQGQVSKLSNGGGSHI